MTRKAKWYLALLACGLAAILAAVMLRERVTDLVSGILCGVGSMATALGLGRFVLCRVEEKYPAYRRANEIEHTDERNVAIRRRAKALSGTVLQWAVVAAAWASMLLDAPLWVTLALIGVFLGKTVLECALMARYQKTM